MEITAKKLSELLNGSIVGNPDVVVRQPSKIEDATEDSVSFISNPKYEQYASVTRAGVLIVNENFHYTDDIRATLILVKDSYSAFTKVLELYHKSRFNKSGIEMPSYISPTASMGKEVYVGAFTYIGDNVKIGNHVKIFPQVYIGEDSVIGDHTIIFPGVKVYHESVIGNHCIIHSGVVIGSDGFGYAPAENGSYQKIPQLGNVIIEDNVEIGANTTIDRATMGSTIIRRGVKLDNLITVAHNVEIGENTVIAAQTGISGSTKIGKNCLIAGQVGFVGHIVIADGSRIGAQSGIGKSIKEPNKAWFDSPAFEYHKSLKSRVIYRNLPELEKRIQELERQIALLKQKG
jgi:UDP-3-O-[3-hydroxymyristoyl] glucosamine N-acyltransferase